MLMANQCLIRKYLNDEICKEDDEDFWTGERVCANGFVDLVVAQWEERTFEFIPWDERTFLQFERDNCTRPSKKERIP